MPEVLLKTAESNPRALFPPGLYSSTTDFASSRPSFVSRANNPILIIWAAETDPRYSLIEKYYLKNSTTFTPQREERLDPKIQMIFQEASEENFEDGMESTFSRLLVSLIKRYGASALEIISDTIRNQKINGEVAGEALRWLGRMNHSPTHERRYRLLIESLSSSHAGVRDSAVLGLTSLGDTRARDSIRAAIQNERCAELREDMEQLLDYLENGNQCHLF